MSRAPPFPEDGRITIDNNIVGRSILPLALTPRNRQFVGGDRWATHAWLIKAARINDIEPRPTAPELDWSVQGVVGRLPQGGGEMETMGFYSPEGDRLAGHVGVDASSGLTVCVKHWGDIASLPRLRPIASYVPLAAWPMLPLVSLRTQR